MSQQLPQLDGRIFLSEAGLETDLIFHHGIDLPDFASFPLLETEAGRATLTGYFQAVIDLARAARTGTVLETPTWRANPDWGSRLGYSADQLDRVNREAVNLFAALRSENLDVPVVISGNVGPRGDGYVTTEAMGPAQSSAYHGEQIRSFTAAGADLVSAFTINHVDEAIGIVMAAAECDMPVVISFTVETDGALPSGQPLAAAITEVDQATDDSAAYFMVNCAHPTHFADVLAGPGPWHRVRGIRANASRMSHEELDNAEDLDRGDEVELAGGYLTLLEVLPQLAVVGGCCGTDLDHLQAISAAVHRQTAGSRR
jgi:S-methylmethionine-dependent homocysteine/selenocysteine methylase